MLSPLIEAKGVESSDSTKSVDEEFKNTEVEKEWKEKNWSEVTAESVHSDS